MNKFLALACAAALAAPAPAATVEEMIPALDRIMSDYQQTAPQPGLVYGLVHDGRLIHVRGFGVQEVRRIRALLGMGIDALYSDHLERLLATVGEWTDGAAGQAG